MIGGSSRRGGGKGACGIVSSFGRQRRRDLNPNECACSCYGTTAINMLKDMQSSRQNVSAAKKENFDSGRFFLRRIEREGWMKSSAFPSSSSEKSRVSYE